MEHRFSKREYFFNCAFTIIFTGFLAVSYFDISTCPYRYDRGALAAETTPCGNNTVAPRACEGTNSKGSSRSLFTALAREGLTCHMADLVIWVYIIGLVLFISQKYYYYRAQGLHYFFLDYCYFHNACFVVFLLWCLVDVQWSKEPLFSWEAYLPREWLEKRSVVINNTGGQHSNGIHTSIAEVALRTTPLANQTWTVWVKELVPSTARQILLVSGMYTPVSVDIITLGYAAAEASSTDVLLLHFLSFFTLLAGSFGPILGAILVWKNALLFHSFDRMSSSYLHLAPAVTQLLLLHRLFTTAWRELSSLDVVASSDHRGLHHHIDALCGKGTLCHELRGAVSYWTLLNLHFAMFMAWQVFYHAFSEVLRLRRQKLHQKKMRKLARRQERFHRPAGAAPGETELRRPSSVLSGGVLGDPTHRVTAYSWLMEHPPLGVNGVFYRTVTIFGTGYLPTMVLFQVMQWILHMLFFTLAYPFMYYSFHVALSASPLVIYVMVFFLLCVYNAAAINKSWIRRLKSLGAIGVEAQRGLNDGTASPATTVSSDATT